MKTCPDCGERVYNLGCVNCNESAYIDAQEVENHRLDDEARAEARAGEVTWGGYPLTWGDDG